MQRICALLLYLLAAAMVIGIVIAVIGFVLAVVAAVIGVLILEASSTPVTFYGLLAVPVFGKLFVVGLIVLGGGVFIFFSALALFALVDFLCFILPGLLPRNPAQNTAQARRSPFDRLPEPKDLPSLHFHEEIRCLIAPLFPAGMMLVLAIPVALFLFLVLSGVGYGLGSPGVGLLIIAIVMLIGFFGLLLALAPLIWCCECRKRRDAATWLNPLLEALEFTATAVQTASDTVDKVKTGFNDVGSNLKAAGDRVGALKISVQEPPALVPLNQYASALAGILIPDRIKVLRGDFRPADKIPDGAETAKNMLRNSGKALEDIPLNGQSIRDTAARTLRGVAAILRSLTS